MSTNFHGVGFVTDVIKCFCNRLRGDGGLCTHDITELTMRFGDDVEELVEKNTNSRECIESISWEDPRNIDATCFIGTIACNLDKLSDTEICDMLRNTIPHIKYDPGRFELYEESDKGKGARERTDSL